MFLGLAIVLKHFRNYTFFWKIVLIGYLSFLRIKKIALTIKI